MYSRFNQIDYNIYIGPQQREYRRYNARARMHPLNMPEEFVPIPFFATRVQKNQNKLDTQMVHIPLLEPSSGE
jgi:hypothetical protein